MKVIKRVLALGVVLLVIAGGVYIVKCRPDIIYGIKSTFKEEVGVSLKESNVKSKNVSLKSLKTNNNLWLINNNNPIDYNSDLSLVNFRDYDIKLNCEVINPLEELIKGCYDETGDRLYIMSSYRSYEEQVKVFKEESQYAATPGYSEHETGLALDLYVPKYVQKMFINSEGGNWVNENCHKYGFIIRYPFSKKNITGYDYEPWHIRYVGFPHSEIMYKNNLTLEEYIDIFQEGKFYEYEDYVIGYFKEGNIRVAEGAIETTISKSKIGGYIITSKMK